MARKCARAGARSAPETSPSRARRRRASCTWRVYVGAVVRFGLLTTAAINGAILGARAGDALFEIVAVGSRDLSRAQAYAQEHGIERAHGSYEDLLADDQVDAVYIALPNALHHEWTMRALGAGKHVLVEKPYTRIPEQVDEAWDEADRRGLVEEAYMWRHSRQTQLILDLLPEVGEVRGVHATFTAMLTREDDPRWVPSSAEARCSTSGATASARRGCCSASRSVSTAERASVAVGWTRSSRGRSASATSQRHSSAGSGQRSANTLEVIGTEGILRVPSPFVDAGCRRRERRGASGGRGQSLPRGAGRRVCGDPRERECCSAATRCAGEQRVVDALLRYAMRTAVDQPSVAVLDQGSHGRRVCIWRVLSASCRD